MQKREFVAFLLCCPNPAEGSFFVSLKNRLERNQAAKFHREIISTWGNFRDWNRDDRKSFLP